MNIFQIIAFTFIFLLVGCTAVQVVEQEQAVEHVKITDQEQATDLEQVADRKAPVDDPDSEVNNEEDVNQAGEQLKKVFWFPIMAVNRSINFMTGGRFNEPISRRLARSKHRGDKGGEFGCAILDAIHTNHCDYGWGNYLKSLEEGNCPDGEEDCQYFKKECLEGEEDCSDDD